MLIQPDYSLIHERESTNASFSSGITSSRYTCRSTQRTTPGNVALSLKLRGCKHCRHLNIFWTTASREIGLVSPGGCRIVERIFCADRVSVPMMFDMLGIVDKKNTRLEADGFEIHC